MASPYTADNKVLHAKRCHKCAQCYVWMDDLWLVAQQSEPIREQRSSCIRLVLYHIVCMS